MTSIGVGMRGTSFVRIPKVSEHPPDYGEGNCLYCGERLEGRQRLYCSIFHGERYRYMIRDYDIINWGDFRKIVLKRDNNNCQDCGNKAEEVHHIKPIYLGGEEFDKDNCISLCRECHKIRGRLIRESEKKPKTTLDCF